MSKQTKNVKPLYEWRWVERKSKDGTPQPDKKTTSTAIAGFYKRASARLGTGKVIRVQIGLRWRMPEALAKELQK